MPNLDIVNNIRKKDDGDDDRGFFSAGKHSLHMHWTSLHLVFYCNLTTDNVIHIMWIDIWRLNETRNTVKIREN